jgi:hypothetical protein
MLVEVKNGLTYIWGMDRELLMLEANAISVLSRWLECRKPIKPVIGPPRCYWKKNKKKLGRPRKNKMDVQ